MHQQVIMVMSKPLSESLTPNPLTAGPDYIRLFSLFIGKLNTRFWTCLKLWRDIDQTYFKIVDLHFVKSEQFSLTWICGSRQRDTTSSGWKFELNFLAIMGLKGGLHYQIKFSTTWSCVSRQVRDNYYWYLSNLKPIICNFSNLIQNQFISQNWYLTS